jgi:peptide subunit release factor 1 (eRF1)
VRVLNINAGHNDDILAKSAMLSGYVTFTGKVREYVDMGMELAAALREAIKYCAEHQILQPFLTNHAAEVINMLTNEFKMEDAIAVWKEEGIEEGLEKGRVEGEYHVMSLFESGYSVEEVKEILQRERERTGVQ